MAEVKDARPDLTKRTRVRPAADEDRDPIEPSVPKDVEPAKSTKRQQRDVIVEEPARASAPTVATPRRRQRQELVQLGANVSVDTDDKLEEIRAVTGQTRRAVIEEAIEALHRKTIKR